MKKDCRKLAAARVAKSPCVYDSRWKDDDREQPEPRRPNTLTVMVYAFEKEQRQAP